MISGRLHSGERLYPAEPAKEIGVSQVPVHEAIGRLESEGLDAWHQKTHDQGATPEDPAVVKRMTDFWLGRPAR